MTKAKKVVFKEDSLEAIKGLIINSQKGLISLEPKEIALLLKDVKELEVTCATFKPLSEKTLRNSGLISSSLKKARSCIVVITGGLDLSLDDLDLIMQTLTAKTTAKVIKMASNCDDSMKNTVKIQLYITK